MDEISARQRKQDEMDEGSRAEPAVLGAVLADNTVLSDLAEVIQPADFGRPAHAIIFSAMLRLDEKGSRVDHLLLAEELKEMQQLAATGGPAYLMHLDQQVPAPGNALDYAKIVKAEAERRAARLVAKEFQAKAEVWVGDVRVLLDEAQAKISSITDAKIRGDLRRVDELMEGTLDKLDKMKTVGSGVTGLPTGYTDLDEMLTGLHGGELLILAARPGCGKTSFAMNIATCISLQAPYGEQVGRGAAIFSLEMPADQLLIRLLASEARVDMRRLRGGRMSSMDEENFQAAAGRIYQAPLYIDDSGSLSPAELRAKARRLKKRDPSLGIIIIDYLQLMQKGGKTESRQLEISEISRSLKQLSKELDIPIVALSQLSRKVEERKGGRPMLSDLRESGAIEQDADVVMFLHREDTGEGEAPSEAGQPVELIVAKQRNGPVGSVDLLFFSKHTRFESCAREHQYAS